MTRKQLRSFALGNECWRVARGYSNCWRLRLLLEEAAGCWRGLLYDGKCSFYFNCYFSTQLQQTEIWDWKLCIFWSLEWYPPLWQHTITHTLWHIAKNYWHIFMKLLNIVSNNIWVTNLLLKIHDFLLFFIGWSPKT